MFLVKKVLTNIKSCVILASLKRVEDKIKSNFKNELTARTVKNLEVYENEKREQT